LTVEKHRHIAEVVVHAQGHHDFRAREVAGDLVRRHRLGGGKTSTCTFPGRKIAAFAVVAAKRLDPEPAPFPPSKEPVITRISRVTPRTLSVAEAARALDDTDMDFLLFLGG
jgi:hypothetical protein